MNGNLCFPASFIRGRVLFWAAVAVFLLTSMVYAFGASAQISQFKPGDRNYAAALAAIAAEEAKADVNVGKKVQSDEDFQPEDFGLQSVGMLPTNPFYFLKDARRGVTSFFTFDPAKKVERNLQFASEKLLEAKTLAEREGTATEDVKDALVNFQDELDRVKNRVESAADRTEGTKAEDLSQKVMDSMVKYGKSITKMEKELPSEAFGAVKDAKDKNAETFGAVFKLVEPEKVSEKLVEVLDQQKGSEFKQFKNLEVLKEVRGKVPEEAKNAIKVAEDDSFLKLQNGLERSDPGQKALFEEFVRETGGSELRHLEIINELEARPLSKELRETMVKAKEGTISRTEDRLSKFPDAEKNKFFEHLKEGELKDVRVVKELENNMRPELLTSVTEVKNEVKQNFANRFESIEGDEKQKQKLFEGVERFHDAKSIAILDEIKDLIPEDKKNVFEEIKKKAADEIKRDIDRARNKDQREVILSSLAGNHPEEAAAMERFRAEVDRSLRGVFDGLRDAVLKGIQTRVESINDKDRLFKFEEEFKKQEDVFRGASQSVRSINNFFDDRRVIFESPDKAQQRIDEARKYVNDLRDLANSLPLDLAYQDGKFDPTIQEVQRMLQLAERKLGTAQTVLDYNDVGRAYGEANAAEQIARDAIRFAQEFKSGKKRAETQTTTFVPFFEGQPSTQTAVRQGGGFRIYNPYEFSQYCFYVQGYMKGPLACVLQDGRVFNIEGKTFPLEIPPEFVPRKIESVVTQPGQVICPTTFAPSYDFCPNGKVIYEKDQRGCDAAPRCERYEDQQYQVKLHPTDKSICGGPSNYQCVSGYTCQYLTISNASGVSGKCVPETQYTCQAYFTGYVFDASKKACRQESSTGCKDPFTYHGLPECEKANGISQEIGPKICPSLPTVDVCPAGQKKVVTYSSKDCGTYYGCEPEKIPTGVTYPYTFATGFVAKDYASAKAHCLANPPGSGGGVATECESKFGIVYGTTPAPTTGNWIKKLWYFSDGVQETSFVLNRTDVEYLDYLAKVEAQCRTIPKNKSTWRPGAGDDRADNWQNFGIPDCSGAVSTSKPQCSDGMDNDDDGKIDYPADTGCYGTDDNDEASAGTATTYPGDANSCPGFAYSRWDTNSKRYCQLNSERRCDYNYPSYLTNGSNYKTESCPASDSTGGGGGGGCGSYSSQTSCTAVAGCTWSTAASGGYCQSTTSGSGCSQLLINLLGTGCHWMYSDSSGRGVYCDGPMTKAAKEGDTTTTPGCQSGTSGGSAYPAAPSGLTATVASNGRDVVLKWNDNSIGEDKYKIYRKTSTSGWGSLAEIGYVSGGIGTYTDTTAPSGTVDYMAQACSNSSGCSADSNVATATVTGGTTPTKPACSDGLDNDNDGKIDYPQDTGCYSADDSDETTPTSTGPCTYYTQATCDANTTCKWVINFGCGSKAQCNDGIDNDNDGSKDYPQDTGCSDAFDNDEATPAPATTSKYPGFFMTPDKQSYTKGEVISLNIKRADVSTYPYFVDLYANESSSPKATIKQNLDVSVSTGVTTQIDTAVTEPFKSGISGTYLLLICAGGETCVGGTNTNSVTVSYSSITVPAAPTGLTYALGSAGNASLSWVDNATNETSYEIEKKTSAGTWSLLGSSGIVYGGNGTYSVEAPPSSSYEYRVKACNSAGCSITSNTVTITAAACSAPGNCASSADCYGAGYFWCTNVNACYSSSSSCPSSGGSTTACNYNGICDSGESSGSCAADCGGGGGGGTSAACSAPSSCYDSTVCASSGWYWYNGGCWSYPQSGSSTSCPSGQYWSGTACVTSTSGGGTGCGAWPNQSDCTSHSCLWNSPGNYCYSY